MAACFKAWGFLHLMACRRSGLRRPTPAEQLRRALFSLSLGGVFLFLPAPSQLSAADVAWCALTKSVLYRQTSALAPALETGQPYESSLRIVSESAGLLLSGSLEGPDGLVKSLVLEPTGRQLVWEAAFRTREELETALPDTVDPPYLVSLNTRNDGARSFPLHLPPGDDPPAPQVQHYAQTQVIDPAAPFLLQWGPWAGGRAEDYIVVEITSLDGDSVRRSGLPGEPGCLDGLATSFLIPAETLQPGRTYLTVVSFVKVLDRNTTDYPGATGFAARVAEAELALNTIGGAPGPGAVRLAAFFKQGTGYLETRSTGTIQSRPNPEWHPSFLFTLTVEDSTFPERAVLSGPSGSGCVDLASTAFFQWVPGRRIYVFPERVVPPWPTPGVYRVQYGDRLLEPVLPEADALSRWVLLVPTLTVNSQGNLSRIDWVFQTPQGEDVAAPGYMRAVELRINDFDGGPNLYGADDLPPAHLYHVLSQPVRWSTVAYLTFEMEDDRGNVYENVYQPAVSPVITTTAIPELPRLQPFAFQLGAFGGTPPYTWSTLGFRPGWLSLSSQGLLSSDSPTPIVFYLQVQVADALGHLTQRDLRMHVFTPEARDVKYVAVQKKQVYRQTSAGRERFPSEPLHYEFQAIVRQGSAAVVSNATLTAAGGPVLAMAPLPVPDQAIIRYARRYSTKPDLDSGFPAGTHYQVDFDAIVDGHRAIPLDLPADDYPPPPFITNWDAAQTMPLSQTFMLAYDPWAAGTDRDFVIVHLYDAVTGDWVAGYPELFDAQPGNFRPSFAINREWLKPGHRYRGWIAFAKMAVRVDGLDHAEYLGVSKASAFWSATEFAIGAALTYQEWLSRHFSGAQQQQPELVGPDRDPDADGRLNFAEYAFTGDPLLAEPAGLLNLTAHPGQVELAYATPTGVVDAHSRVEASLDLLTWGAVESILAPSQVSRTAVLDDSQLTEHHFVRVPTIPSTVFFRLRAERVP